MAIRDPRRVAAVAYDGMGSRAGQEACATGDRALL